MFNEHFQAYEDKYGLPKGVLLAVSEHESSLNPWAGRYEPAFFVRYIRDRSQLQLGGYWPRGISEPTERAFRATSFGLMQLMGQVARELGFVGKYLTQLCDPETGIAYGAMHLAKKIKARGGDLRLGLSDYNDGGAWSDANVTTYADPILARMKELS
jgi:soluble lytic murein transglycosylase-like protein